MENNENKNIDEKQNTEYTFVRETIEEKPSVAVKALKILGIAAAFGLGICLVLFIFNKDIRNAFIKDKDANTTEKETSLLPDEGSTGSGDFEQNVEKSIELMLADITVVFYAKDEEETTEPTTQQETTTALYQEENTAGVSDNKELNTTVSGSDETSAEEATSDIPSEEQTTTEPATESKRVEKQVYYTGLVVAKRQDIFVCVTYDKIKDGDDIYVSFSDGEPVKAEIYGTESINGMAVLRVKSDLINSSVINGITAAEISDAGALNSGDKLIYAGNPHGDGRVVFTGTLTGIESGYTNYDTFYRQIITDIDGNGGVRDGFLFDGNGKAAALLGDMTDGKIAGKNVAGVCMQDMIHVVRALLNKSAVNHIGIKGDEVTDDMRELTKEDMPGGMYVTDVARDSSAYKSGIMVGDIITAVDGEPVTNLADIQEALKAVFAGNNITVTLKRKIGTSYNEYIIKVPVEAY